MDSIIPPAKGQPMRAAWAASVTDAVNRHERDLEATVGGGPVDRRGAIPAPFPFMVVGGTDGNGAAQFVICLPSGCLVNGSTALTPSGITALSGATDRYTVDSSALGDVGATAAAASTLYVVVYQTTGTNAGIESAITTNLSSVTTTTVNGSSQPNGNTILLALPVAKIFTTQVGSSSYGCVAKQLVRSSVWLNSAVAQASSTVQEFKFPYKLSRNGNDIYIILRRHHLMIDGAYQEIVQNAQDNASYKILTSVTGTDVYLNIVHGTNGYSASFGTSATQGAKWAICIGTVQHANYSGSAPMTYNYVVGALILNSGNASGTETVDVLTDVAYSASSHKLTKSKKTVTVLDVSDTTTTTDVFQATDHANEHPNGL